VNGALLPAMTWARLCPSRQTRAGAATSGDTNIPTGFINNPECSGDRVCGFAYDVFGNGKTALRAARPSSTIRASASGANW